ncbi:MAG: hypothetical protein KDK04_27200 [Candidatus Competibacteraceae bacterium]|nr:hypothetical protein [Candidatus Competibacteraceae bacterium]
MITTGVVRASGYGGVFQSGDVNSLTMELEVALEKGRLNLDERQALADWAKCLGAEAGADYLIRVLEYMDGHAGKPVAPWVTDY